MNECKNTNMKLSSPWVIFFKQLNELFKFDPDITINYSEDEPYKIDILVDSEDKYNALVQLMPPEKIFGNVTVQINIIPSNKEKTDQELFETLFKDNEIFSEVKSKTMPAGDKLIYVMFNPLIAQYYADNTADPYGNNNELYADIAQQVFGDRGGVQYSIVAFQ